jgi:putative hydroxymethylpyrimidine transport system substrate-binding protein
VRRGWLAGVRRRWLAALLVLPLALGACGEKHESIAPARGSAEPVKLMLDWFPNADHVGIYQALAEGDFARAGIDLHLEVPSNPADPLQLLAAGKVDAAISYEPQLLLARDQNQPLVSIAALVQEPLTSIVSLGSRHITTPAQLRGKTVGDPGIPYDHAFLETILSHAGVPAGSVREVTVEENLVGALLSGRIDAALGAYWNYEAIQLQQMGKRPNVIRVDQAGVPTYDELVLVVRTSALAAHPGLYRRLVQAMARGYESARADPSAAVGNLVRANPGLDPKLESAAVRATLPAFFPSNPADPWGWQSPAQWNAFGRWMLAHHLISNPAALADPSTNEELAGQGL